VCRILDATGLIKRHGRCEATFFVRMHAQAKGLSSLVDQALDGAHGAAEV